MSILTVLLLIVEVLCSFLLMGVILIQKSKGGGLSGSAFGGGGGDSLFGARAGNVLTKITITLSILFLLNTLVLAFIYAGPIDPSLMDSAAPTLQDIRPVAPVDAPASVPQAVPVDTPIEGGDMPLDLSTPVAAPAVEAAPAEITEEPADL
jgi:preprotein translocase subunit SecG